MGQWGPKEELPKDWKRTYDRQRVEEQSTWTVPTVGRRPSEIKQGTLRWTSSANFEVHEAREILLLRPGN